MEWPLVACVVVADVLRGVVVNGAICPYEPREARSWWGWRAPRLPTGKQRKQFRWLCGPECVGASLMYGQTATAKAIATEMPPRWR